jgi:hypothetical protein
MPTTPDDTTTATGAGPPSRPATETPVRRRPPVPSGARRAPVALAAAVTTTWAALVSVAPVLTVVLLASLVAGAGAPLGQVIRVALAGWLLAHGVELRTGTGPLGLVPLAFSLFAAWRVARAGVHTTRAIGGRKRRSPRLVLLAATSVAIVYGLLGAIVAAAVHMPGLRVDIWRATVTLAGFGFVTALAGAIVESGLPGRLVRRTPMAVRDATRTGVVAALLVLGAGAAAAGTSLALSGGAASKVLAAYHAGVPGQIGLTLVCVVYGPNLAVWAASYLVGPGFALGAGTTVTAARVSLGTVPALPVLAGVPAEPMSSWAAVLLAVPLAAGMLAGSLLARRRLKVAAAAGEAATSAGAPGETATAGGRPAVDWIPLLGSALFAGPVAGGALAFAAWVSAGPLGGGHLAEVGARPWPLGGITAGLVAAGALAGAAATRTLAGVRRKSE